MVIRHTMGVATVIPLDIQHNSLLGVEETVANRLHMKLTPE